MALAIFGGVIVRSSSLMKLLDLFCGAGGAAVGYYRAGFEVVGVDNRPQKNYPFEFIQMDAFEALERFGPHFDAIHASPPCQAFSRAVTIANRKDRPNLIPAVHQALFDLAIPYVIENVPDALDHLHEPITLCGSMFGLPVRRHRLFESNFWIWGMKCSHKEYPRIYPPSINRVTPLRVLSLSGGFTRRGNIPIEQYRAAMGIDWYMTEKQLSEAIPPAYTEYIGKALRETRFKAV
jgi:DNA (cytosine-5)-methyltransferase 1|tara:strand:+ start:304 stop:1011 length:708 start_codon:yes stop_codon:yes gene_type:complete